MPARSVQLVEEPPRPCTYSAGSLPAGPGVRRTCSEPPSTTTVSPGHAGMLKSGVGRGRPTTGRSGCGGGPRHLTVRRGASGAGRPLPGWLRSRQAGPIGPGPRADWTCRPGERAIGMHTTAPARAGDHAASGGVHPATVVATALALAVFGWHAWATLRGYFWQDDFRYISRAATEPLGSFLFHDYGGHLMPGQFLLVRLLTAAAPMQYSVAVLPLLALQAVGYVLLWRLLVRLFGHRWSIVVPFAVVVCAPMTFAATLWWAYALQLVPLQVALLGALLAHVGYLQTGHRGRAVLALACTAAGLACWEKALLIAPVLFGVTVAMQPEGSLLARGVVTLRRHRRLWTGYAVLEVGYLAVYLSVTRDAHQAPLPPAELGRLAERMIADTFLPGVLGGPWQVGFDGPVVLAVPPGWALGVAWAVWAAVVVLSLRAGGRRAVLAWLLLAGYLECCLLLVAVARLPLLGAVIGGDPRYVADAVPVAALCGALALLRPRTAAPQTAAPQ